MLLGGLKFIDADRHDVIAKASTSTSGLANSPQIDEDDVRLTLSALLIDRFKLAVHTEERPLDAYTLLAAKPKLTKAIRSIAPGARKVRRSLRKTRGTRSRSLARLVTRRNMTMAQSGRHASESASGYVHSTARR